MTSKSVDILVNYLLFLISLKSFEGRVRPENGNESQHLVLGDGYTLPSRVIIKLLGFVWNSEGGCCCLLALCSSFTAGGQNTTIIIFLNIWSVCW